MPTRAETRTIRIGEEDYQVILEPDDDVWSAYSPELQKKGAATWGRTKKQALENITQVVKLVLEGVEQPQGANAAADEKGQQAVQLLAATAPGE